MPPTGLTSPFNRHDRALDNSLGLVAACLVLAGEAVTSHCSPCAALKALLAADVHERTENLTLGLHEFLIVAPMAFVETPGVDVLDTACHMGVGTKKAAQNKHSAGSHHQTRYLGRPWIRLASRNRSRRCRGHNHPALMRIRCEYSIS